MLHILSIPEHDKLVGELMNTVYFDPKAPENWGWCVNDKKSKEGSLEYNHETNTLVRRDTDELIAKRLRSVIYGIGDMMEELKIRTAFNDKQAYNYNRLIDMVGMQDYDKSFIKAVKEIAYEGRQFPQALWNRSGYGLETKTYTAKIKSKAYRKAVKQAKMMEEL